MQPTTKPVGKNIVIFLGVIVLCSIIGTVTLNAAFTVTDDIYGGIKIGDIDVGGLTPAAAEANQRRFQRMAGPRTDHPCP